MGFDTSAYQVPMESVVKKDPMNPVNRHIEMEQIGFAIAFIGYLLPAFFSSISRIIPLPRASPMRK